MHKRVQNEYIRTEYAEVGDREFDGEVVVDDPDNTDGGNGAVSLTIQDYSSGDRRGVIQLDHEQLKALILALQARV